jgi:hypothetical protein
VSRQQVEFRFSLSLQLAALPFVITATWYEVPVHDAHFAARLAPWRVGTRLSNVDSAGLVGPFGFVRRQGPLRLSQADAGLTFATQLGAGHRLWFRRPLAGMDLIGVLRQPGFMVTVAKRSGLHEVLAAQQL